MKKIVGILVAGIIALVLGFVPLVDVPYTVTVQYLETETYYEVVPDPIVWYEAKPTPWGSVDIVEHRWESYKRVERERVVVKEREETRHEKVSILEYLGSRF